MTDVKCSDCAEYINEWCEKIIDSPYPDILRDCKYWHERKDMVEVIRCRDCEYRKEYKFPPKYDTKDYCEEHEKFTSVENFCSWAERKKS